VPPDHLIKIDGNPFDTAYLLNQKLELEALSNVDRIEYRNQNARTISLCDHGKLLLVSGPGTGKSTIFINQINHWFTQDSETGVLVISFVRKLVSDLESDLRRRLPPEQFRRVNVSTLHRFARSVLERNLGAPNLPLRRHIDIINPRWSEPVWNDVMCLLAVGDASINIKDFHAQWHNDALLDGNWSEVHLKYNAICRFYNAVGFADSIVRAKLALEANPALITSQHFIFDEYQDFNRSEENLINRVVHDARALLMAGDDDQVLYAGLKSATPELIRARYTDTSMANAMLPYCSRSSFHIVKSANSFISNVPIEGRINKLYLPINTDVETAEKVRLVACTTPTTAVDYIKRFIEIHRDELLSRRAALEDGSNKDSFLLILSPTKEIKFYPKQKAILEGIISEFKPIRNRLVEICFRFIDSFRCSNNLTNNFLFRKILHYEGIPQNVIRDYLNQALARDVNFCNLTDPGILNILEKLARLRTVCINDDLSNNQKSSAIVQVLGIDSEAEIPIRTVLENNLVTSDIETEVGDIPDASAVDIMTIVGSKGLSADHVIVIGFDNVNFGNISKNAFYVAMTRARLGLHIITSLKAGGSQTAHEYIHQLPEEHISYSKYKKTDRSVEELSSKQEFLSYLSSFKRFQ
jgi:superfamily I DNA/RNA helicase